MSAFDKSFEPAAIESKLRQYWEKGGFYKGVRVRDKKPYTIVIPPPNVTGELTMGHMINNTLQDILIRWNRANGRSACWIPGTDHASIATETRVVDKLAKEGIRKKDIGREAFLKHAEAWSREYQGRIEGALKTLGISTDWDRSVFTMDAHYSHSVLTAISKLYKDGMIYRAHRLVNWCPVSQSVISDEEVFPEERNGNLWHIRYPIEGQEGQYLVVATTRPETLFGDLAVAVHPSDERYAHLVGKKVTLPIANRSIPIIADHYVEKEFGTGVVKITPAHDKNDFEVGRRHNLGLLNVMNPDASLNDKCPAAYVGLDRFEARKKLVAELQEKNLLEAITPHRLSIGISERGKVPIEYYLSEQWYIRMEPLAKKALEATRTGRLKFYPAHNEKIWEHWLTNIQDWCISRQLWWGHRMPMYTCSSCSHVMCEVEAPAQCEKCGHAGLKQDEDCLDTWASSWLWPFGVHHWSQPSEENKKDLEYFYPTNTIVTGADIIFFWIARMVMAGEYFTGKTPFESVYFTPIVRDEKGRKMSKSLGNSPNIIEIMNKYGTDAMRFTLVNQIVPGQDIFWSTEDCELGRNFANKIWNATRFLLMNAEKWGVDPAQHNFDTLKEKPTDLQNGWIVSEFFRTVQAAHKGIENFEFADYTKSAYEFVWMVYCDWYIELCKPRFAEGADPALAKSTLSVALSLMDGILRLLHPVMPYLTEEIWQGLDASRQGRTIGHAALPTPRPHWEDEAMVRNMREVQSVVGAIRTIRGQFKINPGQNLQVFSADTGSRFGRMAPQMEFLSKSQFQFSTQRPAFAGTALVGDFEIWVSLDGLVDPKAERDRIQKMLEKVRGNISSTEKRLSNEEFVKNAPAHILAGARQALADNQRELDVLTKSLNSLPG